MIARMLNSRSWLGSSIGCDVQDLVSPCCSAFSLERGFVLTNMRRLQDNGGKECRV